MEFLEMDNARIAVLGSGPPLLAPECSEVVEARLVTSGWVRAPGEVDR